MTPGQVKLALRLYKAYKTGTYAYRRLAEQIGITTTELNRRCWCILHAQPY